MLLAIDDCNGVGTTIGLCKVESRIFVTIKLRFQISSTLKEPEKEYVELWTTLEKYLIYGS